MSPELAAAVARHHERNPMPPLTPERLNAIVRIFARQQARDAKRPRSEERGRSHSFEPMDHRLHIVDASRQGDVEAVAT